MIMFCSTLKKFFKWITFYHLRKWNIKPLFVWNGLNIPKKDRPSPSNLDPRTINRNNAWEAYFAGNFQKASELFQSGPLTLPIHFLFIR
jgi:hypothetical protein